MTAKTNNERLCYSILTAETVADTRGGRRGAQAPPIIFTEALVLKSGSTRKFLF